MEKGKSKVKVIAIAVVIFLVVIIALQALQNSSKVELRIVKVVSVYHDWRCGLSCSQKGTELFKLPIGVIKKAKTVRLGKNFAAFKISHDGKSGWVIGGKGIAFNNEAKRLVTFSDGENTVTFEGAGQYPFADPKK